MSFQALRRRLGLLKWVIPAGLMLLVVLYELGPARWIHLVLGVEYHFVAEILVYGTVGPVLAFWLLDLLGRWLEERETSELQAIVLAQAREHARIDLELNDDTLQSLFALSVLLDSIQSGPHELPSEVIARLQEANEALDQAIRQLRVHLLAHPPEKH